MTDLEIINLRITRHALDRYKERAQSKQSDFKTAHTLRSMLLNSREHEVELKPQFRLGELLNHNFQHARYFRHGQFILVIADHTLVTIHTGTADRWRPVP